MKKLVLVDGNNLMFRSYYATAYTGNLMKNSKGFPTNALYGFISMINKIINEEKPTYMAVAFDIGKNFRKDLYTDYKAGRSETPEELKMQMPISKDILSSMGIVHLEMENYEADDIIGSLVNMAENDSEFSSLIVSSDRDLLQLISNETEIKLLKTKDHIRYNRDSFMEEYKIEPIKIIDLKALAGDSSDNIPGVKGVGDKTALKLLQDYGSLDEIYNNLDKLTPKLREKLELDKENAYFSYKLATIYKEVPLNLDFEELKIKGIDEDKLMDIYENLEFYSFLKNFNKKEISKIDESFKIVNNINEITLEDECAFYLEIDNENYHNADIIGASITDSKTTYYLDKLQFLDYVSELKNKTIYTYDLKKSRVILNKYGITLPTINFDLMIASYLLEKNLKDDIAYLMRPENYNVEFYEIQKKAKFSSDNLKKDIALKSKFIFNVRDTYVNLLKQEDMYELFADIEMPLSVVLSDMEIAGVRVSREALHIMKDEIKNKINLLDEKICSSAGEKFNVNSPRQLGVILFEKLNIPHGKLIKSGYKTDAATLTKLYDKHPIIKDILEYRNLNKLYTTYLEGLEPFIKDDGKIHTIYKQTLTRTGRLSSVEPNLQNIPTRHEEGKKIRKAFIPENDLFLSIDYSQIELRLLAHISKSEELIETFRKDGDIHTKVAADIYGISESSVSSQMRRTAKAVIFGIVYGISGFGLGENLSISPKDANVFIKKYYELYPGVKRYMDNIIKEAYEENVVRTLFNRRRTIEELNNKNYMIRSQGERIALNTPIQGTCADIMKKAMVEIHKEMKNRNLKSKMIIQVHDEIIFDCVKEEEKELTKLAKDIMENVFKLDVPIKAEVGIGVNWYEAK